MVFGQRGHVYEVVEGWGKHFYSPFMEVPGVGVDSKDRVYVLVRGVDPVLVFDSQGNYLKSFGRGYFSFPHGFCVDPDGFTYCTDYNNHTMMKFSPDGELLMTLGEKGNPSDTGIIASTRENRYPDYTSIKRSAGPFNRPTDTFVDNEGNIYVSDGYGNARIHKFSKNGELLLSWGKPGKGPGEFNVPHAVCVDSEGIVYVADRENARIQLFDSEGKFRDQWDANRPVDLFIYNDELYVAELGYAANPWYTITKPKDGSLQSRVSIFTLDGELLSSWGSKDNEAPWGSNAIGNFCAAHCLCVDSKGSVYVGEVPVTVTPNYETSAPPVPSLQKFVRM